MHTLNFVIDIVLAGYVIREVVRFGPQYRQLKLDLAKGDALISGTGRSRAHRASGGGVLRTLRRDWIAAGPILIACPD